MRQATDWDTTGGVGYVSGAVGTPPPAADKSLEPPELESIDAEQNDQAQPNPKWEGRPRRPVDPGSQPWDDFEVDQQLAPGKIRLPQGRSPTVGLLIGTSASEINVLLSNLKLLSNVPAGAKLAIRNNTIILHDKASWVHMVTRMYNGDSREQVTNYLDEFANNIGAVLDNPGVDAATRSRIVAGIVSSRNGFVHIKNTYFEDVTTRTKIETVIENLFQLLDNPAPAHDTQSPPPPPRDSTRPIDIPPPRRGGHGGETFNSLADPPNGGTRYGRAGSVGHHNCSI